MCLKGTSAVYDADFHAPPWKNPQGSFAAAAGFDGSAHEEPPGTPVADRGGMAETLASISTSLVMVRAEYLEMPGLHLTKPQIQRLWNLDETLCEALLDSLISSRFLRRTLRDAYVRADGGA